MYTIKQHSTVSKEEMLAIKASHLLDALPSGYWFDGTMYLDHDGHSNEFHPLMHDFVSRYIATENEKINDFNSKVI